MTLMDSILRFIGSKWFTLFLGLGLMAAMPFTWHNFQVVWMAGEFRAFWWIVAVFICNVLAIMMCAYKFMSMIGSKKPVQTEEW